LFGSISEIPTENWIRIQQKPTLRSPGKKILPLPGILEGIGSAITGAVDGAKCKATELYAEDKLNDPEYLNFQMRCMLNEGECDEVGNLIKRKPLR
jgi:hypothetical protein